MIRSSELQHFLDATYIALDRCVQDIRGRASIMQIFSLLEADGPSREGPGKRLPVCKRFLDMALAIETSDPALTSVVDHFRSIEPLIQWKWRETYDNSASENFLMSHANGLIVGPGGIEERDDLWLGVTLMAPQVRYPDHDHSPEETYLVLSEGEFKQADNEWFSPGIGGTFYNPPGIKHAMRSGDKPLFAFWALRVEKAHH